MRFIFICVIGLSLAACQPKPVGTMIETPVAHQPFTLDFVGPELTEARETFTDYFMEVRFTYTKTGMAYTVPGYFAADGNAANTGATSGTVWRAHFNPPQHGKWIYEVNFKTGPNAAIATQYPEASAGYFDGASGKFTVAPAALNPSAIDFARQGMLIDMNKGYLEHRGTQDLWLKTGAGSPENILAYADFDGTYDAGGTYFPALGENQLHEFEPHIKDAQAGDPTWNGGKGAAILGIGNYYAEVGVNAQYLVSMNIEGDGQDVFPYVSHTDPYVFDVSKLAQWEIVFSHFNMRGVLIDVLLTETENESIFEAWDGVTVGADFAGSRKLYYREMIARFGHLSGLVWNLGEENGVVGNSGQDPYRQPTSAAQRLEFAQYIARLDSYGHAIVHHNWPDDEDHAYGPLLGEGAFSGISLQAHHNYFEKAEDWTRRSKAAGRQWMITIDEPLGWEYGARPDSNAADHTREINGVLWPAFMGGGAGVDWYFGWQNNAPTSDLSNEDQRSRHNLWIKSTRVRTFIEDNVDLSTMKADASDAPLILRWSGQDKDGEDISFTITRAEPAMPEGDGHVPWEYVITAATVTRGGQTTPLDTMSPR